MTSKENDEIKLITCKIIAYIMEVSNELLSVEDPTMDGSFILRVNFLIYRYNKCLGGFAVEPMVNDGEAFFETNYQVRLKLDNNHYIDFFFWVSQHAAISLPVFFNKAGQDLALTTAKDLIPEYARVLLKETHPMFTELLHKKKLISIPNSNNTYSIIEFEDFNYLLEAKDILWQGNLEKPFKISYITSTMLRTHYLLLKLGLKTKTTQVIESFGGIAL